MAKKSTVKKSVSRKGAKKSPLRKSAAKSATKRKVQKSRLPRSGIRGGECSHMVMGPTCGMILGDLGAEVIKIEPPGGDKTRKLPGLGIGFIRTINRNKKRVVFV